MNENEEEVFNSLAGLLGKEEWLAMGKRKRNFIVRQMTSVPRPIPKELAKQRGFAPSERRKKAHPANRQKDVESFEFVHSCCSKNLCCMDSFAGTNTPLCTATTNQHIQPNAVWRQLDYRSLLTIIVAQNQRFRMKVPGTHVTETILAALETVFGTGFELPIYCAKRKMAAHVVKEIVPTTKTAYGVYKTIIKEINGVYISQQQRRATEKLCSVEIKYSVSSTESAEGPSAE